MNNKIICVVGLGYIGLPTAALLASKGHQVVGIDVNTLVVETINQGLIHIVEPDLSACVRSAVASGRLRATSIPQPGDIFIICVPTPFYEDHVTPQPNIDFVLAATRSIAINVKAGDIVILESTSPVGTTQKIAEVLSKAGVDIDQIYIAYCPERVLPGKIMTELVENDRIVGGLTPEATQKAASFYRTFVRGTVLETDAKTAEMCKLTENSFRDVNIAFANELSLICAQDGINVWELIQLANHHPRVNILQPGAGVGGHCIAVDPWFIVARDPENTKIIRSAREVNNHKTSWVINQIKNTAMDAIVKTGRKAKIACLGLSFKPDIDDLRESSAVHIAKALLLSDYDVVAVEPNIVYNNQFKIIDLDEALKTADIIAILVKHKEFINAAKEGKFSRVGVLDFCGASSQLS
jgi:UDP-N-acetyl-D-mannosaminuronic acid dehydrogenase